MWIVKLALSRPYTFVVLAILILIISPIVILRTPTDVFPEINIPVVSVVWSYTGLSAEEMENRIVSVYERVLTTTVNDIEHVESQSLNGIAVLAVHAELALDYFELRGLDAAGQLLDATVVAYERALELNRNRYAGGIASQAEVAQAETQLEATRAQRIDLEAQRAAFEHAIAVLIGEPASTVSIPVAPITAPPPPIPAGLPSELLERRPDVAAAERRVAAANAEIGVARAAFFPSLLLSATGGLESRSAATWLSGPSLLWAVGAGLVQTAFDGGRRRALSDQAQAAYDGTIASYRDRVLTSFQEVEDNLAALRILAEEAERQEAAVKSAERALTLSTNRYKGGIVTYLEVLTAQSTALANERVAVDLLTRRMTASVLLVKALGGGWDPSTLAASSEGPSRAARGLR